MFCGSRGKQNLWREMSLKQDLGLNFVSKNCSRVTELTVHLNILNQTSSYSRLKGKKMKNKKQNWGGTSSNSLKLIFTHNIYSGYIENQQNSRIINNKKKYIKRLLGYAGYIWLKANMSSDQNPAKVKPYSALARVQCGTEKLVCWNVRKARQC